ncbi:hypothetical protein [Sinorhizobium saheli]|uniref:Uncharacterized protein n=1 Tax=Sinorhizobium saheli TaxID=36856 RepID=A0A178XP65_SINSA|nr:hypothetical protein [Sinorhizobium saheli]MQW90356.1 hypothetical protein [Sinorhizobium saheli]OAP37007.1 hypothetical protein ATB98_21850 [Sinorhizobium saheli]
MKTPQRKFVVEFKSRRRQRKAQTNSIWGDTDLQALAREVEDSASHLFNSNEGPGRPDLGETRAAGPIDAESVKERADDIDVAPEVIQLSNGAEVEISKHHEADHPADAVHESQPASRPRTTPTGIPRKRAKRAGAQMIAHNSKVGHEDRNAQTGTVDKTISLDELAALDADNKRLKRLLAEQLRAQNLWLKKMLERFNAG